MRVIAQGEYEGRQVEVTWSDTDGVDGPGDVVRALIEESSSLTGRRIGYPLYDEITGEYLQKDYGFTYVADRVLGEASFHYPDGAPKIPRLSKGAYH